MLSLGSISWSALLLKHLLLTSKDCCKNGLRSQNLRLGLEGTLKIIPFHLPAMERDTLHYIRVLQAPSSLPWKTSRIYCRNGLCGTFHFHNDPRSLLSMTPLKAEGAEHPQGTQQLLLQMEDWWGSLWDVMPPLSSSFWKSQHNFPLREGN